MNFGPQHPAAHGVLRLELKTDGEIVEHVRPHIGYLHRCFEKHSETGTWNQAFPYTDRLNYVSPLINNFGYASAVEKLLGITPPERCQWIRTLMSEVSRVTDHLTCVGASAMELGAFTVFLYMIKAREYFYELVEDVTGGRIMSTYARVGGLHADLPKGFEKKTRAAIRKTRLVLDECDGLVTRNRIFIDRMVGIGKMPLEKAKSYGWTGPLLRASGLPYDVRKAQPYFNETFDFPVTEPELAVLLFTVYDKDTVSQDDFLAQYSCPVSMLRPGVRVVPLYNEAGRYIGKGKNAKACLVVKLATEK